MTDFRVILVLNKIEKARLRYAEASFFYGKLL